MGPNFPPWSVQPSYKNQSYYSAGDSYGQYTEGYGGRNYQADADFSNDYDNDTETGVNYHSEEMPYRENRGNRYPYQTYSGKRVVYENPRQTRSFATIKYQNSYQNNGYALLSRRPQRRKYPCSRSVTCYTCGEEFSNKTLLFAHRSEVHSKMNYYCSICNKQFGVLNRMKEHEKTHTKQVCTECPEVFKFKDSLLAHQLHAHSIPPHTEEPAKNDHVDKSANFTTPVAASTPAASFSDASQDSGVQVKAEAHSCLHCIKSFDSEEKLRSHSKIHTDPQSVPQVTPTRFQPSDKMSCPLCIKMFSTRRELMLHLDTAHTQIYYCRKCPAEYSTQAQLDAHSKVHS